MFNLFHSLYHGNNPDTPPPFIFTSSSDLATLPTNQPHKPNQTNDNCIDTFDANPSPFPLPATYPRAAARDDEHRPAQKPIEKFLSAIPPQPSTPNYTYLLLFGTYNM